MQAEILHSGFDKLRVTVQAVLPPEVKAKLALAAETASVVGSDVLFSSGTPVLKLRKPKGRGFVIDTGPTGANWYIRDTGEKQTNQPALTVDFGALGLATTGLDGAETHFREVMEALKIPYSDHQLRISRTDYAVDFLAPCFVPDRRALLAPPGTKVTEYTGIEETETHAVGNRVTGLRAGGIANRQLAIYDKREKIIKDGNLAWLLIWNTRRATSGLCPLDLTDRRQSQVWRFEYRLGSDFLRNRFEIRDWHDLRSMIGDAYGDALTRMRYCLPSGDSNRSRWPKHLLWALFEDVLGGNLAEHRLGVTQRDVIDANWAAKCREFDRQLLGLFVSRAAVSGVAADAFPNFLENHSAALLRYSEEHPVDLESRLEKARHKYRWV